MVATAVETTTFCTGLWHLKKNSKKNFEQYLEILPKTLSLVEGGYVVAVSDSEMVLDAFEKTAKNLSIKFEPKWRAIEDLPFYQHTGEMLKSCKSMRAINWLTLLRIRDRGRKIYRREWGIGGDDNYRAIMAIWMSKIPLVNEYCVEGSPFGTSFSAWMDASVSRFNERRQNWNFAEYTFEPGKLNHYGTKSRYKGRLMKINCSFLAAQNEVWPKLLQMFEVETVGTFGERYAHDDETIMNRLVLKHAATFSNMGDSIPA